MSDEFYHLRRAEEEADLAAASTHPKAMKADREMSALHRRKALKIVRAVTLESGLALDLSSQHELTI